MATLSKKWAARVRSKQLESGAHKADAFKHFCDVRVDSEGFSTLYTAQKAQVFPGSGRQALSRFEF